MSVLPCSKGGKICVWELCFDNSFLQPYRAGEMISEVGGLGLEGPSRKRAPSVSKGPKSYYLPRADLGKRLGGGHKSADMPDLMDEF